MVFLRSCPKLCGRGRAIRKKRNLHMDSTLAKILGLLATANLVGQLSVDWMFDVDAATFQTYYCVLLRGLTRYPEALRVFAPCAAMAVAGLKTLVSAQRNALDVASTVTLATVGLFSFGNSVVLVSSRVCPRGEGREALATWHLLIFAVLGSSLACQVGSLLRTIRPKTPEEVKGD